MENLFDQQIKKVYESGEFEYTPQSWEKIRQTLQAQPIQRRTLWASLRPLRWFMTAAVMMSGVAGAYLLYEPIGHDLPRLASAVVLPSIPGNPSSATKPAANTLATIKLPLNITQVLTPNSSDIVSPVTQPEIIDETQKPLAETFEPEMAEKQTEVEPEMAVSYKADRLIKENNPLSLLWQDDKPFLTKPRTEWLIQAGVGQGKDQAIMSASLSCQWSLSDQFFIDGALAVHSGQVNYDVYTYLPPEEHNALRSSNQNKEHFAASSNKDSGPRMETTRAQRRITSVALNPTLGFRMSQTFSFKAGVDIQRTLPGQEPDESLNSLQQTPIPVMDIGLTPKVGMQVNKRWQGQIMYRHAINNLGSGTQFFNRNYWQLQLGYKL